MRSVKTLSRTIPGFTALAPSIYVYVPETTYELACIDEKDGEAPSLIILCSWTGANGQHVAKYTREYQRLFSSTRIVLIATTTKDLCFRNSKRKQERLRPAIDLIASLQYLSALGNDSGILMHVFSEGGSNKACELAEAYHTVTSEMLPVSALYLDSTPGHPRYLRLCNAINKSMPQVPILRHAGLLLGSAVLGAIWVTYVGIKGYHNNVITRTRRRLLDPRYFDLNAPRCYMYSKSDALIAWQDIQEHATNSAQIGLPVTIVMFDGSGHVGHARREPEQYWDTVMDTWRSKREEGERHGVPMLVKNEDKDSNG
jgi:hypothetical protein